MKITDYAPRACPFDSTLKGSGLTGVEIGVDVGAHADALLSYNPNINKLHLVDIWENERSYGYCWGRLSAKGFMHRFEMHKMSSKKAAETFQIKLDFIYIDQLPEYETAKQDLSMWWSKLKSKGVLGHRNYSKEGVQRAISEFIAAFKDEIDGTPEINIYANEVIITKV